MANKWPTISGNWSDPLIWNGGTKPVPGDDVYANRQSLYIDETVTVSTLRNAASASAILSSGSFYLNDGVTVNLTAANAFLATVTPLIIISGSNSARINGNNTGTGIAATIIQMTGSSTLTMSSSFVGGNVNGNIIHNSSGSLILTGSYSPNGAFISAHLIYMISTGSLYLTGSLSGNQGTSYGIYKTAGSGSMYIIGNVSGGGNGSAIAKQTFGDIDVTGNLISSTGASSISNTGGGTIRVTGDVRGGGSFFNGIANTGANVLITVTGSIIGAGASAYGINNSGTNSTMIISGNVTGGTSTAAGISIGSNVTLIVTGSVAGSTTAAAIISTTATTIRITGSATAGGGGSAVSTTGASILEIKGPISSSISFPGIQSTSTAATVRVTGPFFSQNNYPAIYSPKIQLISTSTPTYTLQTDTLFKNIILYDTAFTSSLPTQTNVRSGSLYGGSAEFSGSMSVPATSSVRYGVPVDNTTGSATLTPQDIFDYTVSSLTGSNTIGERLKNISTVQTTAATIAAFKGK